MATTQFGTPGNDMLTGTDENDVIFGREGDDEIQGLDGDDQLRGDEGNDTIEGGPGEDNLSGGIGDDTLIGDTGDDDKRGGPGADLIIWNNGDGSDRMDGGADIDRVQVNGADGLGDQFVLEAGASDVFFERVNLGLFQLDVSGVEQFEINGQAGGDDVTVGDLSGTALERVFVNGGLGGDRLDATLATTTVDLRGDAGADDLFGSSVRDFLSGGGANDLTIGNQGDDVIRGGGGDDTNIWNNGDGSDRVIGGAGFDIQVVNGADGAGDEFTLGAGGAEVLFARTNLGLFELDIDGIERAEINGQGGDDTLAIGDLSATQLNDVQFVGGDGNDLLDAENAGIEVFGIGNDGEDVLIGGALDDTFIGGKDGDTFVGNGGADRYVYEGGDAVGVDLIVDFEVGTDTIQLDDLLSGFSAESELSDFAQLVDDGTDTTLQVDTDGGADNFQDLAVLAGVTGAALEDVVETPMVS
ncbi:MAG: calcium-binding protein [Geminicoccaceae bacterium]